ncbi:MAG: hypothetical protein Q7S81_01545 [bacterium]|nr:hypothetical protein [bacterium]
MKGQTGDESFVEKLSEKVSPQNHENLYAFLLNSWLSSGEDCYFFHSKNTEMLLMALGGEGVCISIIRPIENSDMAISISINKIITQKETVDYSVSVGRFNLTKTAGDPVNLAAVRGEIIILDAEAGETQEKIKMTGQYRNYKEMYRNEYEKTSHCRPIQWFASLFSKSNEQILKEKIVKRIDDIISLAEFQISDPLLNRLQSRDASDY